MPSMKPHGAAADHIISSNSTTQHFLGASQRGWMTGLVGNNTSFVPSSPVRPVAGISSGTSASDARLQDAPTAHPAIPHSPMQPPDAVQAAHIGHAQASNAQRAMSYTSQPTSVGKRSFQAAFVQPIPRATSPPGQHQQPLPGPLSTTAVSPFLSSTYETVMGAIPRLDAFLEQLRLRGHLNDLASRRASILKDACICHDAFYLCLHQIFCRVTTDPLFTMQIGFGDEQLRGLDTMQTILLPYSDFPPEVLDFFANFPYPHPAHASPMSGPILAQVRAFLGGLDREWQELRRTCIGRGYPPFTNELRARLRLGSPITQKVLFSSIHRQLTGTDSPMLAEQGLRLFDENQRISQERLAINGYPPSANQVQAEAQQLGSRYLSLRSALQQAGVEISSVSSSPFADANNQGIQQSTVTSLDTGASSNHTSPRSNAAGQVWSSDGSLPSHAQQPFDQSRARVVHTQRPQMRPPYPAPEMQQFHSQIVAYMRNHTQQTQTRRQGRPPLSHNRQISRSATSPTSPVSAVTSNHPPRHMTSASVQHVTTTAAPVSSSPRPRPDNVNTPYPPLLPPLGQELPQGINQNYRIVALHQAYLRSPKYEACNVHGMLQSTQRLYQVPTGYVLPPQVLDRSCPYFKWQFNISMDHIQRRAKDLLFLPDPRNPSLAEPIRQVMNGSSIYRLKCVEVPANPTLSSMSEDVWVTRDTIWPTGIFPAVNDMQLEVRRKVHHGKDLPIDLTNYVKEGLNIVTCALLRTAEELKLGKDFAIAVEVVEIISDDRIKELPFLLKEADAKDVITKSLNGGLHSRGDGRDSEKDKDEDEEIVVVDAHISIDITDPYTARIFELPVRGKTCLHRECFDLQTFLDTRKARTGEKGMETVPTSPDEWKCPICKKDARPHNLVVDGFLQQVRKELEERNQLDVKAIRVQADGSWQPVLDTKTPDRGASANTTTNTNDADGLVTRRQGSTGIGPAPVVVLERWMGQKQDEVASMDQGPGRQSDPVVIELD